MSSATIKPCVVCGRSCDSSFSNHCSNACREMLCAVGDLLGQLHHATPDVKPHIYFYDFAFGDLCDLYTTYLIRRVYTTNLQKQRIVDRALERVERSILTKFKKWCPSAPTRTSIASVFGELFQTNLGIWHWKEKYMKPGLDNTPGACAWGDFLNLYRTRDAARRQLDRLLEGQTMTDKTYEHLES